MFMSHIKKITITKITNAIVLNYDFCHSIICSRGVILLNSSLLFRFKRKLEVFISVEDFFELHSLATEVKKTKTG